VSVSILNLNEAPRDAAERLLYLSGVKQAVQTELDEAFSETYATLRRERRLDWAIAQGLHGKKRILAYTRLWNRRNGRMIHWGDSLDPTSSAYYR